MAPTSILHEAEIELWEAVEHYEGNQPGLGLDFLNEVESSLQAIEHAPDRWRRHDDGTRRYLTQRFPYLVVYLSEGDQIWIVAFAHCRRRPRYWADRLRSAEQRAATDAEDGAAEP